jgi:hypothetical protein
MSGPNIIVLDDAAALYAHAAEEIAHFSGEAICKHGASLLQNTLNASAISRRPIRTPRPELLEDLWGISRSAPTKRKGDREVALLISIRLGGAGYLTSRPTE